MRRAEDDLIDELLETVEYEGTVDKDWEPSPDDDDEEDEDETVGKALANPISTPSAIPDHTLGWSRMSATPPHEFVRMVLESVAKAADTGTFDHLPNELDALASQYLQVPEPVIKVDEEKRLAYGWASVTKIRGEEVADSQGDILDIYDVREATHEFMGHRVQKLMHKGRRIGEVVESIVFTPEVQKALNISLPYEGWFVGVKIHDDATWEKVRKGTYRAFSIGGSGIREDA